jgi:hypothetical protein
MAEQMERIVEMAPAFDKRDPNPSKNYGIHGVDLRMVLKGPKGAIQFLIYTGWHLPHVQQELNRRLVQECDRCAVECHGPMAADVGYHSPAPQYNGQTVVQDDCPYLDNKPCYYDGSGLQAEEVFVILLNEGSEGVWRELERRYQELFGDKVEEPAEAASA